MPREAPAAQPPARPKTLAAKRTWYSNIFGRSTKNGRALTALQVEDQPLHAEFLSLDQLERHGRALANWHQLSTTRRRDRLLPRLDDNSVVLEQAYELVSGAVSDGHAVVPAAEWLLDNFYLIENQIRLARQHLPRNYSLELPQLAGGTADGLPRVYDLALELISHADGLLDAENLRQFVSAYQTVATLKLGELWAIPIMLRLALIENLRRVSARIAVQQHHRDLAAGWAERVNSALEQSPDQFVLLLAEMVRSAPPLSSSFVAEFSRRLQGRGGQAGVALAWLERRLSEQGQAVQQFVHLEGQQQAADQLTIGNTITSLRSLSALDWRTFVEEQSAVEKVLRRDPASVYANMNFATRDRYRHVVEQIAKRSPRSEEQVARVAIELAADALKQRGDTVEELTARRERLDPDDHVGFYLVDRGRRFLENSVGYRPGMSQQIARLMRRIPLACYLSGLAVVMLLVVGLSVALAWANEITAGMSTFALATVIILLTIFSVQVSMNIVNWICMRFVPPRPIDRLDFSEEIPVDCRTVVIVPTMLSSVAAARSLIEQLEVRYVANRDRNLYFGLLTDFPDAQQATLASDVELVQFMEQAIAGLNEKYRAQRASIFCWFHRPRLFNPREGVWMGRERKRGKLDDFNSLLRRGRSDAFSHVIGDLTGLRTVRYVITLDTDTQLPRDCARELIGCMAHPLNRPRFDPVQRRIVAGYSILQPRVATTIPEATCSPYSWLFAGDAGIDPYTQQVSDVYQDLFGEGSFIGKGIYDLNAFESVLRDRFPDNRILSHDLLESCYVRSGLVNDVELFEGFPSRLLADSSRRHRWIRGDWQIASWLRPRVPTGAGREPNPLSWLSWWKLFDNLRRSVTPAILFLLLVVPWFAAPQVAWFWTLLTLGLIFVPSLLMALPALIRKPDETPVVLHVGHQLQGLKRTYLQTLLHLMILPYDVHWHVDAIVRTLIRLMVTKRRLLEWTTASDAERRSKAAIRDHYEIMYACPMVATSLAALLVIVSPAALIVASPILALWLLGPALAWSVSQLNDSRQTALTADQSRLLRRIARRTWRYFETFVTARDHWLAPDNFQEVPQGMLATRTSPTNMGMGLMAGLAAYDFGYISAGELAERSERTLQTFARMERMRGHFYNWYDTRTIQPIEPRYISSVDSGNLAGYLLTMRQGLAQIPTQPLLAPQLLVGLQDTLAAVAEALNSAEGLSPSGQGTRKELLQRIERLDEQCRVPLDRVTRAERLLEHLSRAAAELALAVAALGNEEATWWARAFESQVRTQRAWLNSLFGWLAVVPKEESSHRPVDQRLDALTSVRSQLMALDDGATLAQLAQEISRLAGEIESQTVVVSVAAVNSELSQNAALQTNGSPDTRRPHDAWSVLADKLHEAAEYAASQVRLFESLAQQCDELNNMDFQFLYNEKRELLSIGFNVTEHRMDASYYDLLASEARLASFVAIAQGQLPQEHWFSLGRMMTTEANQPVLLSWSGSMFEYLMPMLVMPCLEQTLLERTCVGAVRRQIQYGRQRGVPWGISESCYNVIDAHAVYQYRAFGVPGLGLQRGLSDDLVIAPYASVMAAMLLPIEACRNLQTLEALGYLGKYGFVDAVDHTPLRRSANDQPVACQTYMAHHSGMSLLALAYVLLDRPMQKRFLSDPLCRAHDLLLQERVPANVRPVYPHAAEAREFLAETSTSTESNVRTFDSPHTAAPEVHLLSNGQYHVLVTNAGGGYSRWRDLAVTRWQEDTTRDSYGQFCYIRDLESKHYWSNTFQPTQVTGQRYHATFSQGRAEFRRVDHEIDCHTTIGVSPEDNVEVRRLTLTNLSRLPRSLELTTYAEVVLAPLASDAAHRAFSNLFVQTELIQNHHAILATRRPRTPEERPPYMFHLVVVQATGRGHTSFETDRARFLGRGREPNRPICMETAGPLTNSEHSVLDPIVSIRQDLNIAADDTARVDIITGAADTREQALALIEKYQDHRLADRVFEIAWTHNQVVLQQLGLTEADVQSFLRMAGPLVYGGSAYRANPGILSQNRRSQNGLWAYGISGDRPIVLLRVSDSERLGLVRRVLQAHTYWQLKGLAVDLVIWSDDYGGYRQPMNDAIMALIAAGPQAQQIDKPGGVFLRRSDQMPDEDRQLLQSVARVVLDDSLGTLSEQLERRSRPDWHAQPFQATRLRKPDEDRDSGVLRQDLVLSNGVGGFTTDGKEYVINLRVGQTTPAPWSNVLANDKCGTVVTESGLGYTWLTNAHEYRLTPWNNDPVSDPVGEAIYVRDEETGRYFSPTPLPARGSRAYCCRHGFGYTIWEYEEAGLATELCSYVAIDAPVKFCLLKLKNRSSRKRTWSVTGYAEWVLGERRSQSAQHIVTEIDPQTGALFARNYFSIEYGSQVAFYQCSEAGRTITCDRTEFVGRNGSLESPAAMNRTKLSGKAGAGLDPCAAIQVTVELAEGEERELVFMIGGTPDVHQARALLQRFKGVGDARRTLEKVWNYWNHTLGAVHVETPDAGLNALANGWLPYQTLACRFWGRSGFYQSGGAFGFRDQLQDSLALVPINAALTRQHLLRSAGRQFREGDVQHWWHPPFGRGVRTRFSDDYLWLPYSVCHYVGWTGDVGVLDEPAPFLSDRALAPLEESYYGLPQTSEESASLYEHCKRSIEHGLRYGSHGLPLIGCGDWNDGMNLVGIEGRGESVWLAFFLLNILKRFAPVARQRGDTEFAAMCLTEAATLEKNIEQHGWDGDYYRRAYFDNGEPLGSAENIDCQIDALPQTWAVIAEGGDPARLKSAMNAVYERLVKHDLRLIKLFDPPFDKGESEPGYIKGYVPGVRENGGQYTHAAVWTTMAFALLGDWRRAWECFNIINPINHTADASSVNTYKVEPYVMAADVYSVHPHEGRGGWTWYTGSAGWMYRLVIETLLGLRIENGTRMTFHPCPPKTWDSYRMQYRFYNTMYKIELKIRGEPTHHVAQVLVDGIEQPNKFVQMVDDRNEHRVEVVLGV